MVIIFKGSPYGNKSQNSVWQEVFVGDGGLWKMVASLEARRSGVEVGSVRGRVVVAVIWGGVLC